MERIQAIAQNVSDIAVKVDQILRHSLLLHGKGGGRGHPSTPRRPEYRVGRPGWGPDFSPRQLPWLPGALCLALSGVPQGSPHRPWVAPSIPLDVGASGWEALPLPLSKSQEYIWVDARGLPVQKAGS